MRLLKSGRSCSTVSKELNEGRKFATLAIFPCFNVQGITASFFKATDFLLFYSLQFARLEFVSLLSSLVKCYPDHPKFSDIATHLTHPDQEVDFFENICHVQLHRRTKAMRKLAGACREGLLGSHSMTGFLVPLANQVIFQSTSNVEQNLVAESVNVISGMCSQLKWTKYCYLLRLYLRLLTIKGDIQKTLIR